jgi:hypothetical protein
LPAASKEADMPSGYSGGYTARWVAVFTEIQTLATSRDCSICTSLPPQNHTFSPPLLEVGLLTMYTDIAMSGNLVRNHFDLQYDALNIFKAFRMKSSLVSRT